MYTALFQPLYMAIFKHFFKFHIVVRLQLLDVTVGYYSYPLDRVAKALPGCLKAVAAVAPLVQKQGRPQA